MRRSLCAALAALAVLLAWPAFAQEADTEDEAQAEEQEPADEAEAAEAEPEEEEEEGEPNEDANRTGAYVGLAGTWGVEKFNDMNNVNTDDSIGFNARAGYRALSWLSAEVQGEWLANFDIDFGADHGNIEMHLIGGNLRLNLPTGLIQPYGLLGGGWMHANLADAEVNPSGLDGDGAFARFGGGMEFYPWPWLALDFGVSYVLPTGDVDNLDFVSLSWGALYRF
jgi:opacity protein-like surface antigen